MTSDNKRTRLLAEGGLALTGVIWGANFTLVKFAVGFMPPFYYLGVRFILAFLIMGAFSVKRIARLSSRQWGMAGVVGLCLFAGFAFQTIGILSTSPGINGFLTCLYVLLVPFFIGVTTGKWPGARVLLGIVLVVGGIGLLTVSGQLTFGIGEILTMVGTIFWALHILALSWATKRMDVMSLTSLQLGLVGFLSLAISLLFERPTLFPGWSAVGAVVYTAIMGGVVAYFLMTWGQRHTTPTIAGVLMSLESVFAVIVSIACGFDSLTWRGVVGFCLAFAGTGLAQTYSASTGPEPVLDARP
ncbi:MAG: EamA family transporter [Actinobacteria bacterium]|nr:EamA family transporter [Actinomycetota bacterium]